MCVNALLTSRYMDTDFLSTSLAAAFGKPAGPGEELRRFVNVSNSYYIGCSAEINILNKEILIYRDAVVPAKAGTQIFQAPAGSPLLRGRRFSEFP
jgi:hypothetical protein